MKLQQPQIYFLPYICISYALFCYMMAEKRSSNWLSLNNFEFLVLFVCLFDLGSFIALKCTFRMKQQQPHTHFLPYIAFLMHYSAT